MKITFFHGKRGSKEEQLKMLKLKKYRYSLTSTLHLFKTIKQDPTVSAKKAENGKILKLISEIHFPFFYFILQSSHHHYHSRNLV